MPVKRLSVADLLPATHYYMTYDGSTTFPACHETVTWLILNKPIYITKQQVNNDYNDFIYNMLLNYVSFRRGVTNYLAMYNFKKSWVLIELFELKTISHAALLNGILTNSLVFGLNEPLCVSLRPFRNNGYSRSAHNTEYRL